MKNIINFIDSLFIDGMQKNKEFFDKANKLIDNYVLELQDIDVGYIEALCEDLKDINEVVDGRNPEQIIKTAKEKGIDLGYNSFDEFCAIMGK